MARGAPSTKIRGLVAPLGALALGLGCGEREPVPPPSGPASPPSATASASAAPSDAAPPAAPASIAGGLRATVTFAKPAYFLGENVLADFCVANTTGAPVEISVGGDYRGSTRALRFKTAVTDERGAPMPDPDPNPMNFGGIGYSPKIKPGEPWCASLQLMRYARIDAPGKYRVTVHHDLGWAPGTAPTAEGEIVLRMPSPAEAEGVVAGMESLPRDPSTSAGKTAVPWADFTALRYPVYLSALLARAQKGSVDALVAIGQIPSVEATRALVGLLASADRAVARGAAPALALRLPDPALQGALGPRNVFANEMTEQRKYLAQFWSPDLGDAVRAAARSSLASSDVDDVRAGAFMLTAVGTPADAPAIAAALSAALERTKTAARETNLYPPPRGATQELLRAGEIVVARGHVPPAPKTPGEVALYLVALSKSKPKGWEGELGKALAHPIPYVQKLALERVPAPVPPEYVSKVDAALGSSDVDAQIEACHVVEKGKLAALRPSVLRALAKAREMWLVRAAEAAAIAIGAYPEALDAIAAKMADPSMTTAIFDHLLGLTDGTGRSAGQEAIDAAQAKALAGAWAAFVKAHRADVLAKRRVPLDDAPKALAPKGWTIHRAGGKPDWP